MASISCGRIAIIVSVVAGVIVVAVSVVAVVVVVNVVNFVVVTISLFFYLSLAIVEAPTTSTVIIR